MQGRSDVDTQAAFDLDTHVSSCMIVMNSLPVQGLDLLSDYDYIAIFDADFKPDSDFLVSSSCPLSSQPPQLTARAA